jgi:hypothetical protein
MNLKNIPSTPLGEIPGAGVWELHSRLRPMGFENNLQVELTTCKEFTVSGENALIRVKLLTRVVSSSSDEDDISSIRDE